MSCSKLTWSDLKADSLNQRKAGPKGACFLLQLAIITRGDPCTTEFLDSGKLKHQFQPPQDSYHNICYLNKTRRHVTQE